MRAIGWRCLWCPSGVNRMSPFDSAASIGSTPRIVIVWSLNERGNFDWGRYVGGDLMCGPLLEFFSLLQ